MTTPFIGRFRELDLLETDLSSALQGEGRVALLVGEAGIGKTRLADRIVTMASERGAQVYWGRCWQGGGAPPFWPWVQVLRSCMKTPLPAQEEATTAWALADIASIVSPPATGAAEAGPSSASRDSEQARFRLFDAVATFLHAQARQRPLVLVLDDLHDADEPSLLLLNFLARDLRGVPILLVATFRDVEVRRSPALTAAFAALAKESRRLTLSGLQRDEVGQFIDTLSNAALDTETKDAVCRMTEGNPFYVDEVIHVLMARPAAAGRNGSRIPKLELPDTVREAIRQRLGPVSAPTRALLEAAAAVGRDFELALVARLVSRPREECEAILEEARRGGLVERVDNEGRSWRFVHVLIRDTLHDDAGAARVAGLHHRIAELLEEDRRGGHSVRAATLAHHLLEAAALADAEVVFAALMDAGREAVALLGYEDAARTFARAVDILEQSRGAQESRDETWDETQGQAPEAGAERRSTLRLADVLLELAHARRWAGEQLKARELFQRVVALLRPHSDDHEASQLFARAVLGFGRVSETGKVDEALVALLEEALLVVGDGDSQLRASLLARVAMALYFAPEAETRLDYSHRAVAMASRLEDPRARINALVAHHFVLWGPDTARERLGVADSVIDLCDLGGERELALEARLWRVTDLLELGEVERAASEQRRYSPAAELARLPTYRWHAALMRASFALLEGRLDDSQRESDEALAMGLRAGTPNAQVFHLAQMFRLRGVQGRLGELEPFLRQVADAVPSMPIWAGCLSEACLSAGRRDEARREYARLAANGFAALPRDGMWLPSLAVLSRVAADLADRDGAAQIHDFLLPYRQGWVVSAAAIAVSGPVSLFLGIVCGAMGDVESARRHLAATAELCEGLGYRTLVAECEAELRRLDGVAGAEQPRPAPAQQGAAVPASPVPPGVGVFCREADFWTLALGGPELRLRDSKGMRYIHYLLENPDRDFHVLDLVTAVEGSAPLRTSSAFDDALPAGGESDTGPLVDAAARSAYKKRLRELKEEIDEAEADNDAGRAEALRAESDFLARELASAFGLGGRERRSGSQAEQVRVRLTKVIGLAMKRIAEADPSLGRLLAQQVRTGTFCAYHPDPDRPLRWKTRSE